MGFWGVEVKPKKKVNPFSAENAPGKLRITQATLGLGSSSEKVILQCFTDPEHSIFLCSLIPDKTESCPLDLEFDEDDSVAFSVIGSRSIHLSGYCLTDDEDAGEDDYEIGIVGEDAADTDSEDLSEEYDSEEEYDDDFTDESDYEMFSGPAAKSGVVIEEITEDEEKKDKPSDLDEKKSQGQIVVKDISGVPNLESEDEDGFPLSLSQGNKAATKEPEAVEEQTDKIRIEETKKGKEGDDHLNNKKRDAKSFEHDDKPDKKKKRKKEKRIDKVEKDDNVVGGSKSDEVENEDVCQVTPAEKEDEKSHDHERKAEKKKKKKKKKAQESASNNSVKEDQPMVDHQKNRKSNEQSKGKPSQVRTFPNGLVIEEIAMGKPDGKKAAPGKQVSVHYIGKLQKNGKIFDSNVGIAPFKFRLGIGQVIKGWDVGVNGMRIGDKRRLTIPPSMGYGSKGAGGKIPPNSWLMFDVELVDVR